MFIGFREAAKLGFVTIERKKRRKAEKYAVSLSSSICAVANHLNITCLTLSTSHQQATIFTEKKDEKKKQTKQRTIITHKEKQSDGFECPHSNQTIEETIPGQQYTRV